VESADVRALIEKMLAQLIGRVSDMKIQELPFPVLSYQEAMARFGIDRPDLRFGMELIDLTDAVRESKFGVFAKTAAAGGQIKALCAPGAASFSRKKIDALTDVVKARGAKGLVWMKAERDGLRSSIAKFLTEEEKDAIIRLTGASEGDLILAVADKPAVVAESLSTLRTQLGAELGLAAPDTLALCWVVDFPLLEWSEEEARWVAVHHPFTSAKPEQWPLLETDPGAVLANAYDVVCNGMEIGGGSIRIHDAEHQSMLFRALGISDAEAQEQFGHLLEAFSYGAPPHGGIALGMDRLIEKGEEPIHFDHDCREGICGMCSLTINGIPHGKDKAVTTCQLHMRKFRDGDTIWIEPFRSHAFPVLKDLVTDRSSLDRIQQAGGFVSVRTGAAPDAHSVPIPKDTADAAFSAAACIGCGACVAACKNASAMLFVAAKISHLGHLPQGQPERDKRALAMVHGPADGRRTLRQLHQPIRMRGGLPEGNQRGPHRPHEPRLRLRPVPRTIHRAVVWCSQHRCIFQMPCGNEDFIRVG